MLLDSLKHLDQKISHINKEQEKVLLLDMNLPISRTFSTAGQLLNLSISMIFFWTRRKIFRGRNSTLSRSKLFIPNFHSLKLHWKKLLDNLKHLHQNISHQNKKGRKGSSVRLKSVYQHNLLFCWTALNPSSSMIFFCSWSSSPKPLIPL